MGSNYGSKCLDYPSYTIIPMCNDITQSPKC